MATGGVQQPIHSVDKTQIEITVCRVLPLVDSVIRLPEASQLCMHVSLHLGDRI